MAKGSAFDDLVKAALKQLQSGRPQAAVRSTIDDAIKGTSSAAAAAKSALAKIQRTPKPRVTSKTAGTTSARPAALYFLEEPDSCLSFVRIFAAFSAFSR